MRPATPRRVAALLTGLVLAAGALVTVSAPARADASAATNNGA